MTDETFKPVGLFNLIDDVSSSKKGLFHAHPDNEKAYAPFMVNLMLSQHPDSILVINELNARGHMPKKWQHDYLFHKLPKRKRFAKLAKPLKSVDIDALMDYFNVSLQKAIDMQDFYTAEDFKAMRATKFTGGMVTKKSK